MASPRISSTLIARLVTSFRSRNIALMSAHRRRHGASNVIIIIIAYLIAHRSRINVASLPSRHRGAFLPRRSCRGIALAVALISRARSSSSAASSLQLAYLASSLSSSLARHHHGARSAYRALIIARNSSNARTARLIVTSSLIAHPSRIGTHRSASLIMASSASASRIAALASSSCISRRRQRRQRNLGGEAWLISRHGALCGRHQPSRGVSPLTRRITHRHSARSRSTRYHVSGARRNVIGNSSVTVSQTLSRITHHRSRQRARSTRHRIAFVTYSSPLAFINKHQLALSRIIASLFISPCVTRRILSALNALALGWRIAGIVSRRNQSASFGVLASAHRRGVSSGGGIKTIINKHHRIHKQLAVMRSLVALSSRCGITHQQRSRSSCRHRYNQRKRKLVIAASSLNNCIIALVIARA